jgi:hypothetical protein
MFYRTDSAVGVHGVPELQMVRPGMELRQAPG